MIEADDETRAQDPDERPPQDAAPTDHDPAAPPAPPSNPPRDEEAVERSEDGLRKVTGR